MKKIHNEDLDKNILKELSIDCKKCSGLCCVSLFFSKMDGFPENKVAGKPCMNLMADFRCSIHSELVKRNMKGCLSYDCFGAGQKVISEIFKGEDWKSNPQKAEEIYEVFLVVHQLHQMLWYLVEANSIIPAKSLKGKIGILIMDNQNMTKFCPEDILKIDIEQYRPRVNKVLREVSQLVSAQWNQKASENKKTDFMGKDFKKANLNGMDLSMTLLIAANLEGCNLCGTNFLGADMRDANLKNTDLSESIFMTQGQVNSARGNCHTKLPLTLSCPTWWN